MKNILLVSAGLAMLAMACQQNNQSQNSQKQPVAKTCENLPHQEHAWRIAAREACVADSWQPPTLDCFFAARSSAESSECAKKLNPTQRDYLEYRVGTAAKRPTGWSCTKLKAQFEPLLACKDLSEHATIYLQETKQIIEEVFGTLANQLDPTQARATEMRCISVARLLAEFVGKGPCPS